MAKGNSKDKWDLEPQKSSATQFITYIASTGVSDEKCEIRASLFALEEEAKKGRKTGGEQRSET